MQSSYAMSQRAQCRCAENFSGGDSALASPAITVRTVTWPLPIFSAASSASMRRARFSAVNAIRSCTTSTAVFVRA